MCGRDGSVLWGLMQNGSSPAWLLHVCRLLPPTFPCSNSLQGSSSRELSEGSSVAVAPAATAPAPLPLSLTQGQATSWHLQPREFLRDLIFKASPTSPGIDLG